MNMSTSNQSSKSHMLIPLLEIMEPLINMVCVATERHILRYYIGIIEWQRTEHWIRVPAMRQLAIFPLYFNIRTQACKQTEILNLSYQESSVFIFMSVNHDFRNSFWLPGGCAASQSEAILTIRRHGSKLWSTSLGRQRSREPIRSCVWKSLVPNVDFCR